MYLESIVEKDSITPGLIWMIVTPGFPVLCDDPQLWDSPPRTQGGQWDTKEISCCHRFSPANRHKRVVAASCFFPLALRRI